MEQSSLTAIRQIAYAHRDGAQQSSIAYVAAD
jgi:hypothetical protein